MKVAEDFQLNKRYQTLLKKQLKGIEEAQKRNEELTVIFKLFFFKQK